MKTRTKTEASVVAEFLRIGLILESDHYLPSVAGIVVGGRIKGSWWGHPKGREVWHALRRLQARSDVLTTRLISGKITFVHRRLWHDFLAIAVSGEKWQTRLLSTDARRLFRIVEKEGTVRTDRKIPSVRFKGKVGDAARELERRLLVHSDEVHTETGSHAKVVSSWATWSESIGLRLGHVNPAEAEAKFETILGHLNKENGGSGRLQWID
jgi:hypothetical protein